MLLRRLALTAAACLVGCSTTMRVPLLPPRHIPARSDLAVAIAPLGDSRPHTKEDKGAWLLVPLVPFDTSVRARPDEDHVAASSADHFRAQVRHRLAEQLAAAGVFARVAEVEGVRVDPAAYPLVLTGELRQSSRRERRTTYGLSVGGLALWLLGAPVGWDEVEWELVAELRDARDQRVLKTVEARRTDKRWTGLYWGAPGFPDGEAEALRPVLAELIAGLDAALTDVPELAALAAHPIRPPLPTTRPPTPVRLGGKSVLVVATSRDETLQGLAELVCGEVERQTGARVLGMADINSMLGLQAQRELVGCTEDDCFADVVAALSPDHVLTLTLARVGADQVLTLKVLDPRRPTVPSRTSFRAAGAEPSALVDRLPEIVAQALRPLALAP